MNRPSYPTDLTDAEGRKLARLLPPEKHGGRPRKHPRREVLDAIFHLLRAGCAWRLLPAGFPPWKTVHHYFRRWRLAGVWRRLHDRLRRPCRRRAGRAARPTAAAIIDSQSVRTTERGGPHGYGAGKKLNGRKRHLLVDSSGLVLCAHVHPADIADRDGAVPLLTTAHRRFGSLRLLWADMGYRGRLVEMDRADPGLDGGRGAKAPALVPGAGGRAHPVCARLHGPEKTLGGGAHLCAWLGRYRRLSRDDEFLPESEECMIYLAMTRLMLARLCRPVKLP